jgi:SAM-dependent methyltransferase
MPVYSEAASEASPARELAAPLRECLDILECPLTRERLIAAADGFRSAESGRHYPMIDGIPNLFVPLGPDAADRDVTEIVKAFYEKTPFPNYDDLDSRASLAAKAKQSLFAAMLDEQLPDGAVVLEAGCGTGQLTNFLGLSWKRRVFGGDICLNSLRIAKNFRDRFSINNAAFLQMNLFRPPFRDGSLDVIVSNGVLHHTGDPRGGFEALLRKLKPGGLVLIGLYNSLGRLPTLWRRRLFERFGASLYFLDRRLISGRMNEDRWQAWFRDQYAHPHETRHSIGEMLRWFDANNVEFLSGIPPTDGSDFALGSRLFAPQPRGTAFEHWMTEVGLLIGGGRDGGLFIMIGRKKR